MAQTPLGWLAAQAVYRFNQYFLNKKATPKKSGAARFSCQFSDYIITQRTLFFNERKSLSLNLLTRLYAFIYNIVK